MLKSTFTDAFSLHLIMNLPEKKMLKTRIEGIVIMKDADIF